MKTIQQYCDVVDRMKQDPACKQAVLEKARRPRISLTKRGMVTGSAVAAALIALNIGIGGHILHRAADDSMTADSQTIEVTEAVQTTASAEITAVQTVTTAKPQKHSGEKAVTVTAADSDSETRTTSRTETAAAVTDQATAQTQPKQDAVPPAAAAETKSDSVQFSLIPADRPYEVNAGNAAAPIICHIKPSELVRLKLTVRNDPGMSRFFVCYNIRTFDTALMAQVAPEYKDMISICGSWSGELEDDRDISFGSYPIDGWNVAALPDDTVLAETVLLAPSKPGRYVIQDDGQFGHSEVLKKDSQEIGQQSPVCCEVSGIEFIVDEEDYASAADETWLIDPERKEGPVCCIEQTVAHAGQKNIQVNMWVRGAEPFESGWVSFGYDPALRLREYDAETRDALGLSEDERTALDVAAEGTLLEHAPHLVSVMGYPGYAEVSFDNFREITRNGKIYSDQDEWIIREDGVLFRLCFDAPEECGRYRIYVRDASFSGLPDECPYQCARNCLCGEIIVVP